MGRRAGSGTIVRTATTRIGVAAWITVLAALLPAAPARAKGFIQIQTNAIVLTPTVDDYANDYVEATGPFGIQVRAKNTGSTGFTILVRCSDPVPEIAIGDLLVRTTSPPGDGGTTMATWNPVTMVEQTLWTTGVHEGPFADIDVDVRIQNLINYAADPFGTPTLTNTLVFTVIEP